MSFATTVENEAESTATALISTITRNLKRNDLSGALRRVGRVKAIVQSREVSPNTAGTLILLAAEVARIHGRNQQSTELVMQILNGKGGISLDVLGKAKRLRARLLLDEGKIDEAEVLAGTADRYIVTGLVEEQIETSRSGKELRVNVPVPQKFLDQGEHISIETYLLLAEIAALGGNWDKAAWNVQRAQEKQDTSRLDSGLLSEMEVWRGILHLAQGGSLLEIIEPLLKRGDTSPFLIARAEALLGEFRREDSPINCQEFERFRLIGESARLQPLNAAAQANDNFPFTTVAGETSHTFSDAQNSGESFSNGNPGNTGNFISGVEKFRDGGNVIEADLTLISLMRLVEIAEIEKVTGEIEIVWNRAAVVEALETKLLNECVLSGKGRIYCLQGRFIDAEINDANNFTTGDFSLLPPGDRSEFFLRQLILICLGAGSETLLNLQSGAGIDLTALPPENILVLLGAVRRLPAVAERDDVLQLSSNLNYLLNVSKDFDELKSGTSVGGDIDDDEWEKNWDLTFGAQSNNSGNLTSDNVSVIQDESAVQTNAERDGTGDEYDKVETIPASPVEKAERQQLNLADEITDILSDKNAFELNQADFAAENQFEPEIAPPWQPPPFIEKAATMSAPAPRIRLALGGEEISLLTKAETWAEANSAVAEILGEKLHCGVRAAVIRSEMEIISSSHGGDLDLSKMISNDGYVINFPIVEQVCWSVVSERQLDGEEIDFAKSVLNISRLALFSMPHPPAEELANVGGVAIFDDEWLSKFMVPPRSLVMRKKINEAQVYANQDGIKFKKMHILLSGETGTGKDVFARLIHEMSERRDTKFVRADMGAVGVGDQFIATLFGAAKGSYTGQVGERRGLVEEAAGGTLFLNEIGNLSLENQRALLDFMQEGCYTRLGDTQLREADVRIILATNENINDAGKFRQDVKFRCAPPITLPSLRERRVDIAPLAINFAGPNISFREGAIKLLEYQQWEGNVRELQMFVHTAAATINGQGEITVQTIEKVLEILHAGHEAKHLAYPVPPAGMLFSKALEDYEKFLVEHSLNVTKKKSEAARLWGETPAAMTKKIKKWNLGDEREAD